LIFNSTTYAKKTTYATKKIAKKKPLCRCVEHTLS
jgi:hypothetical protein